MELSELKSKIKSSALGGWYLFGGEEDYLKKHYLKELREAIVASDDPFALFNHVVFDGASINLSDLAEAIKSPPMMSEYKLVEWKFANFENMKPSELSALVGLFSLRAEHPYTILAVMTAEDGLEISPTQKKSKLYTTLSEGFDIINFQKSTDAQLLSWLKRHFDAEGIAIDGATLSAMLFRVGHSMESLNNEVIKLSAYAKANGNSSVNTRDVEEVCAPTVECDAFALSNAVTEKNANKAFAALTDLKMRRVEPYSVIAMLERTYSELVSVSLLLAEGKEARDIEQTLKLHPFKTRLAITAAKKLGTKRLAASLDQLRKIDAMSKSGGITGYGAIEMFITQSV